MRERDKKVISLCQDTYITKLAAKFNLDNLVQNEDVSNDPSSQPNSSPQNLKFLTPLPVSELTTNEGSASKQEIYAYQQRVGSINFAAISTRPDISKAASKLAEFLINPSPIHLQMANRVLQYLNRTKRLGLTFQDSGNSQKQFEIFSDASYGDNANRFSSFGYTFSLFGGLIDWKATKQKTITTSSTESELLAISATVKETI